MFGNITLTGIGINLDIAAAIGAIGVIGTWLYTKNQDRKKLDEETYRKNRELVWKHCYKLDVITKKLIDIKEGYAEQDKKVIDDLFNSYREFQFEVALFANDNIQELVYKTNRRIQQANAQKSLEMIVFALVILIHKALENVRSAQVAENYVKSQYGITINEAVKKYEEFSNHFK